MVLSVVLTAENASNSVFARWGGHVPSNSAWLRSQNPGARIQYPPDSWLLNSECFLWQFFCLALIPGFHGKKKKIILFLSKEK
jgi:hypothetical protein